ncbi:hypothetical protein BV25DRAFT_1918190 [Artomyces pyxidatus]|uniref:Uncharacterized protein n=1 Tax=Artomyces pyxidatus TaxID=48021 RepID=A0ACB8STG9_9AGAM|nr:hypothetical protein BV25DRAFT_1918190 [Artomyces pyxidatus]
MYHIYINTTEYLCARGELPYDHALHEQVVALSSWDGSEADIFSVSCLAAALGIVKQAFVNMQRAGDMPSPQRISFEWRELQDGTTEYLYISGARFPIRVWMVGRIQDIELEHFYYRPGPILTVIEPVFEENVRAANAVLTFLTNQTRVQQYYDYRPHDAITAYGHTAELDATASTLEDTFTRTRSETHMRSRLYDATDLLDPREATVSLTSLDFDVGDLVLQEVFICRTTYGVYGDSIKGDAKYELRYLYKLADSYSMSSGQFL